MRVDGKENDVWIRCLADMGYVMDMHMSCQEAVFLAIDLLRNVEHRYRMDDAIKSICSKVRERDQPLNPRKIDL